MLDRKDEARQSFLAAARLDVQSVASLGTQMLLQNNDCSAALYYYSIALEAAPNDPLVILNTGQVYRQLGRFKEARDLFKRGYEITPVTRSPFDILYSSHFRLLLDTGEYKTIHRDALTKVGPRYAHGQFFVALAFFKEGNMQLCELAARRYFQLQRKKPPTSIADWAKQQIHAQSKD